MRLQLSSGCASDANSEAEEGVRQPAISGKWRSKQSIIGGKGPGGYGSRIGERWGLESEGGQESRGAMEDKRG